MKFSKFLVVSLTTILFGASCVGGGSQPAAPPTGGMWFSPNQGSSWQHIAVTVNSTTIGTNNEANVVTATFDPNDSSAIYVGTREFGMYYSYDNGRSWQQPKEITTGSVNSITIHPKDKCTIVAAVGVRLYKSEDCNRSYQVMSFIPLLESGENIKFVSYDWFNPAIMYAAASRGRVFKSFDGGNSWAVTYSFDSGIMAFQIDPKDSRVLFVGTEETGLWKSVDGASHFGSLKDITQSLDGSRNIRKIAADTRLDGHYVVATTAGLIETFDKGGTWKAIVLLTPPHAVQITAVALDPSDPQGKRIYYGTDKIFYRTGNGGVNWESVQLPTKRAAGVILVHPADPNAIYLGAKNL
ncbi:MAG: hypothetical protein V1821_03225 [bacterium]